MFPRGIVTHGPLGPVKLLDRRNQPSAISPNSAFFSQHMDKVPKVEVASLLGITQGKYNCHISRSSARRVRLRMVRLESRTTGSIWFCRDFLDVVPQGSVKGDSVVVRERKETCEW
uniref:Uncharacterized protein n=1 Tax=Compsopogon caeruleus TaxID=31354 RepID=A0A6T6DB80_9RHOD|mmetsp:Transcript_9890/g.20116  ORF Transcript_9890/g.20116 Transcript_9890/m.20116 type:complete len:116 (+) Transcript_9890:1220-1567(+)